MKRPSVFLSRSNAGNSEAYRLVKKALEQEGVDIVEYSRGAWNPKHMLDCDRLVIVPHELIPDLRISNAVRLGKGQHSQICDWVSARGKSREEILIVAEVSDEEDDNRVSVEVTEYKNIKLLEDNWTTDYSLMTIDKWSTCCFGDCWDEWNRYYDKLRVNIDFDGLGTDKPNVIKGKLESLKPEINSLRELEKVFYDPASYRPQIYKSTVKMETLIKPMLCLAA